MLLHEGCYNTARNLKPKCFLLFYVVVFLNVGSAECGRSSSSQQARHAGFDDSGRDLPVPHPQLHNGSFLARPGLLCPHWRGVSAHNLEQPGTVVGRGQGNSQWRSIYTPGMACLRHLRHSLLLYDKYPLGSRAIMSV